MLTQMWAANPAASRVAAEFIPELTADDINLLAAEMPVRLEAFTGRPAHQCNLFATMLVQRQYLQLTRARLKGCAGGIYDHVFSVSRLELVQFDQ